MQVNGREIGFRRSVRATADLAEICPNKDITKLGELMNGGTGQQLATGAVLIHVLNDAYVRHERLEHPDADLKAITVDEIMDLDEETYMQLLAEAMLTFKVDGKTEVRTKPAPSRGKKTQAAESKLS